MAYRKTEFVERKRLATRARIIDAATELVRTGGWKACQLKTVAAAAGVSTGSVYTHFDRIADLYIEVFRGIAEAELEVMAKVADGPEPATERLDVAVDRFAARALRGRVKAYAVIGEPVPRQVEVVRQRYRRRFVTLFQQIIEDGMAEKAFDVQDAATTAACTLGALAEALILPLAPEAEALPDRGNTLRWEVRAFCRRAVGAKTTHPARKLHLSATAEERR